MDRTSALRERLSYRVPLQISLVGNEEVKPGCFHRRIPLLGLVYQVADDLALDVRLAVLSQTSRDVSGMRGSTYLMGNCYHGSSIHG
jgi:hypothetical protein